MVVNKWYSFDERKCKIIHKKLNYDLYRFNLKNEPSCICEFECENCYYFLWNVLYMIILEAFICNSKKLWRDRFEYQFIWEYRTFNIS